MSSKSALSRVPCKVSGNSVQQKCQAKASSKSVKQEWPARVSRKSVKQECLGKSVKQERAFKSALQECPARVSSKSVKQKCPFKSALQDSRRCCKTLLRVISTKKRQVFSFLRSFLCTLRYIKWLHSGSWVLSGFVLPKMPFHPIPPPSPSPSSLEAALDEKQGKQLEASAQLGRGPRHLRTLPVAPPRGERSPRPWGFKKMLEVGLWKVKEGLICKTTTVGESSL